MPAPATVTLRDIELVRVGEWAASTGPVGITRADLAAMVAAHADPEVDRAAIRIGHVDPRFDGEPALGWVENLRVDGDVLRGDLVEVPAMLAELIPRAFRRRSVEIAWQVRTPGGRQHVAALAGLALLGVQPPAVKGLADVAALYGRTAAAAMTVSAPHQPDGALTATSVTALALDDGPGGDADDRVAIRAALSTIGAAVSALEAELDAIPDPTITQPPDGAPHTGRRDPDGGPPMTTITDARVRELLGLEESADIEAELERIAGELASGTGDPAGDPPAGDPPADPPADPAAPPAPPADPEAQPGADPEAQPGAGTPELVTLSAGNLEELRRAAAEGAEARRILADQERASVLRSALSSGRIAPADAPAWTARLDADLEGTRTLLSSLTPAFSTSELGSDLGAATQVDASAWDAFEAEVFGIEAPAPAPTSK